MLVENLARVFISVEIAKLTAYTRKVNRMFGKRASLAITGSVVHVHNMYRESGDSSGATRKSGKSCEKRPVYS